jgi:hypothetical protein
MKDQYSKNYYRAREAQERLGIDKNRFNYLVRVGKVKKFVPPGHSQGLYLKSEVDRLAREMLAFVAYDETQGVQFMKATIDKDFREEHELATLLFGNAVHSMEVRRVWLKQNPNIDFIVREHGRLVGFINLLPAKHGAIMQFMNGEIRGWDIKADDVLPFTSGSTMECIIMGMATTPDVDIVRRTQYGARLISGLIEFLIKQAQQSIIITKFYATSATPTGISILRNAGFKELNHIGKRIAFELEVMTSDSLLVSEYRRAIEENKTSA